MTQLGLLGTIGFALRSAGFWTAVVLIPTADKTANSVIAAAGLRDSGSVLRGSADAIVAARGS